MAYDTSLILATIMMTLMAPVRLVQRTNERRAMQKRLKSTIAIAESPTIGEAVGSFQVASKGRPCRCMTPFLGIESLQYDPLMISILTHIVVAWGVLGVRKQFLISW